MRTPIEAVDDMFAMLIRINKLVNIHDCKLQKETKLSDDIRALIEGIKK